VGCACNQSLAGPVLDLINPLDGTPWYKTPIGIGALVVGAFVIWKFAFADNRPKIYVVRRRR
jgi:hypothetical protein